MDYETGREKDSKIDYVHCDNCNKIIEHNEWFFYNSKGDFCTRCGEANSTLRYGCSQELLSLIEQVIETGMKFTELVDKIWQQGEKEGLSRQEIADIVRPIARRKGGLNKDQVYYLTHKRDIEEKARKQYEELKKQEEYRNIPSVLISEEENEKRIFDRHNDRHRFYLICRQFTEGWIEKNIPEQFNEISKFNRAKIGIKLGKMFGERMLVDIECMVNEMSKVSKECKEYWDDKVLDEFYDGWMNELFAEIMLTRLEILKWFEEHAMKEIIEHYKKHPISEEQEQEQPTEIKSHEGKGNEL
jgi:hypothetical protein